MFRLLTVAASCVGRDAYLILTLPGFFLTIAQQLRANPPLYLLLGAVAFGVGGGLFFIQRNLRNDPTLVLVNKANNPYPWMHVSQGTNIKLYAVNQKFDASVKKGLDEVLG
ncbi:hypothetical protein HK405_013481 [Cladochytrium tenue]|nr:hypothetical protein HK405_013481 [Cladochytrium tenue]